jgi:16S rRNA (adenine1518-N6/adenine1519-N6)-dimethyltransferase
MKPFFDAAILQEEIFTKRAEQLTVEEFAALTFKMG